VAEALGNKPGVMEEWGNRLREDVQRLGRSDQPPGVAWEKALARLGAPGQLAAEFAKVSPAPAFWLPARIIPIAVFAVAASVACLLAARPAELLLATHVLAITVGYVTAFAIGALAAWSILSRAISGWDARRANALRSSVWKLALAGLILTVVGLLLGGLWAQEKLGRFWGWDLRQVGVVSVVAWYCLTLLCLRLSRVGGLAEMVMGVVGNGVVYMSWFGVNLFVPLHSYGFPRPQMASLVVFVAVQLAILGITMVPPGRLARSRA